MRAYGHENDFLFLEGGRREHAKKSRSVEIDEKAGEGSATRTVFEHCRSVDPHVCAGTCVVLLVLGSDGQAVKFLSSRLCRCGTVDDAQSCEVIENDAHSCEVVEDDAL